LKLYFFVLALILPFGTFAQEVDVPDKVKIQFTEDFISASKVKWNKGEHEHLTVIFFHQSQRKKATYSKDGILLALKIQLTSLVQVPEPVASRISKQYRSYSVDRIWQSQIADSATFDFLIHKDKKNFVLTFLPSGKLTHKIKYIKNPADEF
jgi:hypothetical protein